MAVKILADSTCDIPQQDAFRMGVTLLPLHINLDGREYLDGVDLTHEEFYRFMRSSPVLPRTTQVGVTEFEAAYRACFAQGADELVVITISHKLSGTMQAAQIAAEMVNPGKIFVVDSLTFTIGFATLIHRAAQMRDEGCGGAEIAAALEDIRGRAVMQAVIGDLKYLRLGGRLSAASATVGGMLHIKPTVRIDDGEILVAHKSLGLNKSYQWMIDTFFAQEPDYTLPLGVSHAGNPGMFDALMSMVKSRIDIGRFPSMMTYSIGAGAGTHCGPDTAGFLYFKRTR